MDQDESVALWRQGKEAWNAWAEEMLRQKAELEQAGKWQVDDQGRAQNGETRAWIEGASVDFSALRFASRPFSDRGRAQDWQREKEWQPSETDDETLIVDRRFIGFERFVFPWETFFDRTQFYGKARFGKAQFHGEVQFVNAQFHDLASLEGAQFQGVTRFGGVQFHDKAEFRGAKFDNAAWFVEAQFQADAQFWKTQFRGDALFTLAQFRGSAFFLRAQFHDKAKFGSAQFQADAQFGGAQFYGEARFNGATFKGRSTFRIAKFGDEGNPQDADFTGIKVERTFDMTGARFSKVPAFNQANFVEAPDLDDVEYPQPLFRRFRVRRWENGAENKETEEYAELKANAAKYRHLRRLAILGHDHENEAKAFKGETRAKRGTEHLPWHGVFWFGMGYDALSDFGRSLWRPFYAWLGFTLLFAAIYLCMSSAPSVWECAWTGGALNASVTPVSQAIYLAIKNGLIFAGLGLEGNTGQAHACLSGGSASAPIYPLGLSIVQMGQSVVSSALIFLFLLGVRNRFKIN